MTNHINIRSLLANRKFPLKTPDYLFKDYVQNFIDYIDTEPSPRELEDLLADLHKLNQPSDCSVLQHGDIFAAQDDYRYDKSIIWDDQDKKFLIYYNITVPGHPNMDYDVPHPHFPLVTTDGRWHNNAIVGHYGFTYLFLDGLELHSSLGKWFRFMVQDGSKRYLLHCLHHTLQDVYKQTLWEWVMEPDEVAMIDPHDEPKFYITSM